MVTMGWQCVHSRLFSSYLPIPPRLLYYHTMDTVTPPTSPAPPTPGVLRGSIPELSRSPVHLLSALVTLASDKLWDLLILDMAKAMPLEAREWFYLHVGLLLLVVVGTSATLSQWCIEKDDLRMALAKGMAMGILAGLPYSFGTSEMGLIFLGWSGINELQKMKKPLPQP